ncbi:hypothetical protein CSPX01_10259 [Colletotrichum filicis]|nr:hypothetical protein CSPX01_10259 [Colletotrichum filicis]
MAQGLSGWQNRSSSDKVRNAKAPGEGGARSRTRNKKRMSWSIASHWYQVTICLARRQVLLQTLTLFDIPYLSAGQEIDSLRGRLHPLHVQDCYTQVWILSSSPPSAEVLQTSSTLPYCTPSRITNPSIQIPSSNHLSAPAPHTAVFQGTRGLAPCLPRT